MPSERIFDAMVVGGGLAGSAAAVLLARAGCKTLLIEKESKPQHKVCGEFLSHEALSHLRGLGVDVAALGAVPITAVRLAGRLGVSETPLPFAAMSLTRRSLDEELMRLAEGAGACVQRGSSVQSLVRDAQGWQATLADASPNAASAAFLATGKHDVHGLPRPAGVQSNLIAFKMYWQLTPAQTKELVGHVELNLYRGGYAGLQPVEGGVANLCCLIRRSDFQRMGGRWESLLQAMQNDCSHLKSRLHGAEPLLARPLAVSPIPYGFVRPYSDGLWALGDQAAVIPSFTGDGMSIALHSGVMAAEMYLRGDTAEAFQQRLHEQLAPQVALAMRLSQGLVAEPQRTLMETVARLWPGVLRVVASRTRVSTHENRVAMDAASVGIY